jgi:hypothetical protein
MSTDSAYIAAMWEHPELCVALFGVQFLTPAGQQRYDAAGITEQMTESLEAAQKTGLLLLNRPAMTPEGPVLIQYWRSYEDLDRWARTQPHSSWWRWLLENAGEDLGFYHEIYQARTAEAIYEHGTRPVGPALFCSTEEVPAGGGQSRARQQRFADSSRP